MFRKLHDPGPAGLTIMIDGRPATAESGESIAAVLLREPAGWSRTTPVSQSPRAPYCMMGVCFECLVEIEGVGPVQGCLTPVADGMVVNRQQGRRNLLAGMETIDE